MQKQNLQQGNIEDIKAIVIVQCQNVVMHRLINGQKSLFTSGICKIAAIQNKKGGPAYFLNLGSFYYGINTQTYFIKVEYMDSISYVFPHFQNGLSAISLNKQCSKISLIDETLSSSTSFYEIKEALGKDIIKKQIEDHYPNIQNEQIHYPDNIKKAISISGKYVNHAFSYIGTLLQTGVSTVGNYLNSKVPENQQPKDIQPQTIQKWHNIKSKATGFLKVSGDFANNLLNPVLTKTKQISKNINEKIQNSENDSVKYVKEIAQVSGKAFEEAFGALMKSGAQVTKQLGEQGKKLIAKKYGQQIMHAIVEDTKIQQIQRKEILDDSLNKKDYIQIQQTPALSVNDLNN